MKEKLFESLISSIGNGMIKNIVSAEGTGADTFLFNDFSNYLENKFPDSVILNATKIDKKYLKETCLDLKSKKSHSFILIKNLWGYDDFDSIINICAGNTNIDIFAISSSKLPLLNKEKITLVRGRVMTYDFPSTLYEDYMHTYKNKSIVDFLFNNDLNKEVISSNLQRLTRKEKACLDICLDYNDTPLTFRSFAKKISERMGINFSRYHAQNIFAFFESLHILQVLDRYDLKKKKIIEGKIIYPIDTRFYESASKNKNIKKYMTTAIIAKLFYDGFEVKKSCYSLQNKNDFKANVDGGFLIKKDGISINVFIMPSIDEDNIDKIHRVPYSVQKVIITPDVISDIHFSEDGLIYYSCETLLKEGLKIYAR